MPNIATISFTSAMRAAILLASEGHVDVANALHALTNDTDSIVLSDHDRHWSDRDRYRAAIDGWLIAGGTIERVDDPSSIIDGCRFEPAFASDEDALMHVESEAARGSDLHRRAIMEITINGSYSEVTP